MQLWEEENQPVNQQTLQQFTKHPADSERSVVSFISFQNACGPYVIVNNNVSKAVKCRQVSQGMPCRRVHFSARK